MPPDRPFPPYSQFDNLILAVIARSGEWDTPATRTILYRATELGGEAGELLNKIKKVFREEACMPGSRATTKDIADEMADVIICVVRLAVLFPRIDLWKAIVTKFNNDSEKQGLSTRMEI